MADLDVTIAIEAINNARGPLEEAAAQLERLEEAARRVGQAGVGAGPLWAGAGAAPDFEAERQAGLAEAATSAAAALQAEAVGLGEVNALLGEGLAMRLALVGAMAALEGRTLSYQASLGAAAAAGQVFGAVSAAAAQGGAAGMRALEASLRAVTAGFARAVGQALRLRSVISSMGGVKVSASLSVSGLGGGAAGGGEFVTSGPTLLLVGDNPGGRELVSVEPLSGRGQTRLHPRSGLVSAGGGLGRGAAGRSEGVIRVVVPVVLDGVEVGRGAIEGTLEALQQRGLIEGALVG